VPHDRKDANRQDLSPNEGWTVHDLLTHLDTLDDVALDHRGRLSSGVEGSTEENFRLVASHKRTHTEDIRAAFATTGATDR
jgi:hypothetical protein